jgi:hypothetical protein
MKRVYKTQKSCGRRGSKNQDYSDRDFITRTVKDRYAPVLGCPRNPKLQNGPGCKIGVNFDFESRNCSKLSGGTMGGLSGRRKEGNFIRNFANVAGKDYGKVITRLERQNRPKIMENQGLAEGLSEKFDFKGYGVSDESLGPILNDFMNCDDIDTYFDGFHKKFKTSVSQFKQFSQAIANQWDNILVLYFCLDSFYQRSKISYKQRLFEENCIIKDLISSHSKPICTNPPKFIAAKPIPEPAASTKRILRDLSPESKQNTKERLSIDRKSQTQVIV